MNYWPALPCNMPELIEPLESLIRIIKESGSDTARDLYGKGGFTASHNSDIFGYSTPAGGQACWSLFPVSAGWLARELFNKYEYTLDKEYLQSVYDIFEGVCEFFLDSLVDDGEYLIMTPSASPENKYLIDGVRCAVAKSTTMTASIVRDSLISFVKASEILSKDGELVERAKAALPRLLPLRITDDGRIEEWYFGGSAVSPAEADPRHRHISHLYDLYPAKVINRNTPELFSAAKESLRVRGDEATGWSLGWKMLCYARLYDSEGVMRLMRMFMRPVAPEIDFYNGSGGIYPNLMCAHPPFQIDGNFAFAAAVCEMLVDEEGGLPIALPALPKELATGSIKGMLIKGGRLADISWCDGKAVEFKIYKVKKETE